MNNQRGDISIAGVIGIALLIVAYMLYPDPIHDFVRFIIHTVLEAVRDAFGNSDDGGAKDAGQLRLDDHAGSRGKGH